MARAFLAAIALCLGVLGTAPVSAATVPDIRPPTWAQLNPKQREILAPLAAEWDQMEDFRQRKWLEITKRYPSMSAEERKRVRTRMEDWARLRPEERRKARQQYHKLQRIPPQQREALTQKWEEYQALPDEEKQQLKAQARRKNPPGPAGGLAHKPGGTRSGASSSGSLDGTDARP